MQDFGETRQTKMGSSGAILSMRVAAGELDASFGQCGRLVDYIAKYAAIHREDVERGARMFSAVWNGVIEAVAKNHAGRGAIALQLRQAEGALELGVQVPVEEAHARFWAAAATLVSRADLKDWYLGQIRHGALDGDAALLGIAEMAATFRAQIRIAPSPAGGAVDLAVVFPLSEMEES